MLYTGCQGVEGEGHTCQEARQRGDYKISLESRQSDDPVHKYKVGKNDRMPKDDPFKIVDIRSKNSSLTIWMSTTKGCPQTVGVWTI